MVRVLLSGRAGAFFVKADGHALFDKKGRDIVCAAVSVLLRTAARTLKKRPGAAVDGGAPERGAFFFEARAESEGAVAAVDFARDFLREGLSALASDFPQNVLFECNLEE